MKGVSHQAWLLYYDLYSFLVLTGSRILTVFPHPELSKAETMDRGITGLSSRVLGGLVPSHLWPPLTPADPNGCLPGLEPCEAMAVCTLVLVYNVDASHRHVPCLLSAFQLKSARLQKQLYLTPCLLLAEHWGAHLFLFSTVGLAAPETLMPSRTNEGMRAADSSPARETPPAALLWKARLWV